ncbi:MAG: chloride channel protein [Planctomycetota bacterium]|nr:chloride channel protein [Planctomycetota bacterium]
MSDLHQDIKLETRETARLWRREVFSSRAWARHALFVVAAVLTGLVAWYFQQAEVWGRDWFNFLRGEGGLFGSEWRMPGILAVLVPMLVVTGSMLLIMQLRDRFYSGTEGTGIPQAIAALKTPEGPFRSMMLSWRIAIGKIFLLTIGLFSGMTIGREGPSVHVGACLMYLITKITHYPAHLVRRGLILGGGGAGIAAAFNAPIAGIIFAFEEIGRSFEKNNAGTVIRTVILASLVVVLLLGKDYLFYGQVKTDASSWTLLQWSSVLFIGIIGGFLGGFFAQCVVKGTRVVGCCMKWNIWITPLVIGGSLALLGLVSGGETYGSGYPQAEAILIPDADGNTWSAPWHYAPLKACASFFSLVSGIPGGLFDPSLSVGAGLGQTFVPVMDVILPGIAPEAVIMMFMVAYFAGVVQSPLTCGVIMVEMTGARYMTIPLLMTAVVAYECSRLVCRTAIYEALADIFLGHVEQCGPTPPGKNQQVAK